MKIGRFVVAALIAGAGVWIISDHTNSTAELERQSAASIAAFNPQCDGKSMREGDACLRYGGGRESRTYDEEWEAHKEANSVATLAAEDRVWRRVGWGVIGFGALVAVLGIVVPLLQVAVRRRTRRRLAADRGWTYLEVDPDLNARLGEPVAGDGEPAGYHVLKGTYEGQPFIVYDYQPRFGSRKTRAVVTLPSPVPRLSVNATRKDRIDPVTSPEGRLILAPEAMPDLYLHQYPFAAEGTHLSHAYHSSSTMSGERLDGELRQLRKLGKLLVEATTRVAQSPPR